MKVRRHTIVWLATGALCLSLLGGCGSKKEPLVININSSPPPAHAAAKGQGDGEAARAEAQHTPVVVGSSNGGTATIRFQTPQPRVVQPGQQVIAPPSPRPVVTRVMERVDEASFFNTQVHDLAAQILKNFRGDVGPEGPIAVATFVDLNDLYRTSPLGRYLAEQLMGELQRAGFTVVDVRKTNSMLIKQKYGEYSLSRSVQEIAKETSARYILVGTYVVRDKFVLINARLVSNDNNVLLSSGMKIMRRDPFIERMLWPSAAPPKEPAIKLPVKGFGEPTEVRLISGS